MSASLGAPDLPIEGRPKQAFDPGGGCGKIDLSVDLVCIREPHSKEQLASFELATALLFRSAQPLQPGF